MTLKTGDRNALQDVIHPALPALKAWRAAVPTFFAANRPLASSLPKPTPGSADEVVLANPAKTPRANASPRKGCSSLAT